GVAGRAERRHRGRSRGPAGGDGASRCCGQGRRVVPGGPVMKVFVAGSTGVLGRRAVRLLVAAGHDVTAAVRSEEKAALVRAMGAHPVRVDLFDAAAVEDAVRGHEAVVNLATHIPPMSQTTRTSAWAETDRTRREVSPKLVDAAPAT